MIVDLRSDTVTRPTPQMLEAMWQAEVGDDVFGEDPSVIALEQKTASLFGKEAALFCPSGTMTNQIALRVHTQPQDEVICHRYSHIYNYEGGGAASNAMVSLRMTEGNRGRLSDTDVRENINPDDIHFPRTRLVSLENTVNKGGGCYYQLTEIQKIHNAAREHNLKMHLDGARLFNALVETGEVPINYGRYFDTLSICFSKGLGAPVGSAILGDSATIKQARRVRKVFGGAMRQAGYLAAAASYALDHHVDRLKEDHDKARILAGAFQKKAYTTNILPVDTNIVIVSVAKDYGAERLLKELKQKGILAVGFGHHDIRLVTHLGISDDMLEYAQKVI